PGLRILENSASQCAWRSSGRWEKTEYANTTSNVSLSNDVGGTLLTVMKLDQRFDCFACSTAASHVSMPQSLAAARSLMKNRVIRPQPHPKSRTASQSASGR